MGWLTILSAVAVQSAVASPVHHLLIPEWNAPIAKLLQPSELLFADEDAALVAVTEDRVETFSMAVHSERKGCGGFFDVSDQIQAGRTPASIVWTHLSRKYAPVIESDFGPTYRRSDVQALVDQANDNELWDFLTELTSFDDRSATSDLGTQSSDFLFNRAKELGAQIPGFTVRKVVTGSYPKQPSVVATLPGLKPELPHVVIGGHMDTFTSGKPGADDDGSGTAVVMESLRTVMAEKARFDHPVDFIWYAAEERGLVGSQYVVKEFKEKGIKVKAVLQMDMTGLNNDEESEDMFLIMDYTNAALNTKLKELIQAYTTLKVGATECGYACSDHASWTSAGIPAVFPFEASFDNMNYRLHTSDDKMTYLDKRHAGNFARVALAFIGDLAVLR